MILVALGTAAARTVSLGCPEVGQAAAYRVRTEVSFEERGTATSLGETTAVHRLEVLSVEGPRVRLGWTRTAEQTKPPTDPALAGTAAAAAGLADPPLVLILDLSRRSAQVEDVGPLLRTNEAFFAAVEGQIPGAAREPYRRALLDPELAEAAALEPLALFVAYSCRDVRRGRSTRATAVAAVQDEVPVPAVRATRVQKRGKRVWIAVEDGPTEAAATEQRLPPGLGVSARVRATRRSSWLDGWDSVSLSVDHGGARWVEVVVAERVPD